MVITRKVVVSPETRSEPSILNITTMPATMANWPIRFSQAVHQPHRLFFIFDAQ